MARFGRMNISMRRKPNMVLVVIGLIELLISMFMGDKIILALKTNLFGACTVLTCVFYSAYDLLGLLNGSTGSSLIGIFGIIGVTMLLLGFVKMNKV